MLMIGHRGTLLEPENTLLAFEKAIESCVDMIELDVHKCKSGEIVVIHDDTVDRTSNGHGYIKNLTYQELKNLDFGKGQKIPTLEEVLDLVDKRLRVNIEIKQEGIAFDVSQIVKKYINEKKWPYESFLISSFNQYELLEFKKILPDIRIGVIFIGVPIGYAEFAVKLNAYSIHLSSEFINKKFVEDAHAKKIKIFVFTINDKEEFKKIAKFNIDGFFTDYPNIF